VVKWLAGALLAAEKNGGIGGPVDGKPAEDKPVDGRRPSLICAGGKCHEAAGKETSTASIDATGKASEATAPLRSAKSAPTSQHDDGQNEVRRPGSHLMQTGPVPGEVEPGKRDAEMLSHKEQGKGFDIPRGPSGQPLKKEFTGGKEIYVPKYDEKRTKDHGWGWLW
jgi:hypothetical protein